MKKLFTVFLLSIMFFILSSCKETPPIIDEEPFGELVLSNVELVNELPNTRLSTRSLKYSLNSEGVVSNLSATSYNTLTSTEEWLAIYINQPTSSIDRITIVDIVISVNEIATHWQPLDKLNGRSMEIRKENNENILYIPIETAEIPGTFEYQIEQIRYIGVDNLIYRVSKNDESIDSIAIIVRYPLIGYPWDNDPYVEIGTIFGGLYEKNIRSFILEPSINSEPDRKIYNIRVNDILIFNDPNGYNMYTRDPISGDIEITNFVLPESFDIVTTDWLKIKFDYEIGYEEYLSYETYVASYDSEPMLNGKLTVYSDVEFALIGKNVTQIAIMVPTIHIPDSFLPFTGGTLSITGYSYEVKTTITFDANVLYLFNGSEVITEPFYNRVNLYNINIEKPIKVEGIMDKIILNSVNSSFTYTPNMKIEYYG